MAERGRPRSFDRAAALHRAMEVFWARGYDGASMADLTAAMGINSPSLYAAFGCKEALFREALELYETGEGGSASRSLQEAPTARAGIEAMLRENAVAYTAPDRPPGCMIVLASAVGIPASPEVRDYLVRRPGGGRWRRSRRGWTAAWPRATCRKAPTPRPSPPISPPC